MNGHPVVTIATYGTARKPERPTLPPDDPAQAILDQAEDLTRSVYLNAVLSGRAGPEFYWELKVMADDFLGSLSVAKFNRGRKR